MKSVILLLIVSIFSSCLSLDLPPDFRKCKRSDPDFDNCLKTAFTDALLKLEKGVPELKFPPIDVIKIPSITINEGKGPVRVVQKYYDVEMRKLTIPRLDNLKSHITDTDFKLDCDLFYDEIPTSGKYDFNGKILFVPIVGIGDFRITFSNMKLKLILTGTVVDKKGKSYIEMLDVKTTIDLGNVKFHFENLFNGDEKLSNEIITLMNDNWKDLYLDVKPQYDEIFETVIKNFANSIFKKVPYESLFPK